MGAERLYTPELASEVCRLISIGHTFRDLDDMPDMPTSNTIFRWLRGERIEPEESEAFGQLYARAKDEQIERLSDNNRYIAEHEEDVNRARLMIDTNKWYASKLKPKKYGDIRQIDGQLGVDIRIGPSSKPVGAGTSQVEHKPPKLIE